MSIPKSTATHLKDERGVGRDDASRACLAISVLGGNRERRLLALRHAVRVAHTKKTCVAAAVAVNFSSITKYHRHTLHRLIIDPEPQLTSPFQRPILDSSSVLKKKHSETGAVNTGGYQMQSTITTTRQSELVAKLRGSVRVASRL